MAIKIIKKGNKTFKTLCSKCDCLFSYQLNDLCSGTFICCPECGSNIQHSNRIKKEKTEISYACEISETY